MDQQIKELNIENRRKEIERLTTSAHYQFKKYKESLIKERRKNDQIYELKSKSLDYNHQEIIIKNNNFIKENLKL